MKSQPIIRLHYILSILLFTNASFASATTEEVVGTCKLKFDLENTLSLNVYCENTEAIIPFEVENPNRIVLDLPKADLKLVKEKIYKIVGSKCLKSIRIGSHPDKERVVIDRKNLCTYDVKKTQSELYFQFKEQLQSFTPIPTIPVISADLDIPVTSTITPTPTLTLTPTSIPTILVNAVIATPITPLLITGLSATPITTTISTSTASATPTATATATPTIKIVLTNTHIPIPTTMATIKALPTILSTPIPNVTLQVITSIPKSTLTSTITPKPISTPTSKPSLTPTATKTPTITPTPTSKRMENIQISKSAPSVITGSCLLNAIEFKHLEHLNQIKINFSERVSFKISKENSRRYKVSIPECALTNKGLLLPQFPPNDVTGFTLARVVEVNNGLDIIIGTDDGMKASALNIDSTIVVSSDPSGF